MRRPSEHGGEGTNSRSGRVDPAMRGPRRPDPASFGAWGGGSCGDHAGAPDGEDSCAEGQAAGKLAGEAVEAA
jgi:hypothetical protein